MFGLYLDQMSRSTHVLPHLYGSLKVALKKSQKPQTPKFINNCYSRLKPLINLLDESVLKELS